MHSFPPHKALGGRFCCYPHLQMEKLRLREVKQLAPQDREGLGQLGIRADALEAGSVGRVTNHPVCQD